jgi:hypothetical protein
LSVHIIRSGNKSTDVIHPKYAYLGILSFVSVDNELLLSSFELNKLINIYIERETAFSLTERSTHLRNINKHFCLHFSSPKCLCRPANILTRPHILPQSTPPLSHTHIFFRFSHSVISQFCDSFVILFFFFSFFFFLFLLIIFGPFYISYCSYSLIYACQIPSLANPNKALSISSTPYTVTNSLLLFRIKKIYKVK